MPPSRRKPLLVLAVVGVVAAVLWGVYEVGLGQPSNQRDWEFGVDRLPQITIRDDTVHVQDLRDFRYTADGPRSADFVERVYELSGLERVWLVEEPFSIAPFTGFEGIAHTY